MNKIFTLLLLASLVFVSCNREETITGKLEWGTLECFGNFPGKPYVSDTLRKTLRFEFNSHAQGAVGDIKLQLFDRVIIRNSETHLKDTVFIIPEGVVLLKDGVRCDGDNILVIKPQDKKIEIGIIFTDEVPKESHTYNFMLKVIDNGGLDRIGNIDVSKDNRAQSLFLADQWEVGKKKIWNPLGFWVFWGIMVIAIILIVLFIIIRADHPEFKIRELRIEYYTPEGELCPPYQKIQLKGCFKVVCANKKPGQSVFSRIFQGKVAFAINDFWDKDICLRPKSNSKNTIRIPKNPYDSIVKSINKGEPTEFLNSRNEKVIFNF